MEQLPSICVLTIPHKNQKYDTAGDYAEFAGPIGPIWDVRISKMDNFKYEALVLIHELVEMILTKNDGVSWEDIDEFDINGEGKDHPDPGTLDSAPYKLQHERATEIEKLMASFLGVNWQEYENTLDQLEYR